MELETATFEQSTSQDAGTQASSQEAGSQDSSGNLSTQQAQAAYELEKLGKIKFDGEEWTPDSLKKAIMRQKDYTQKTQSLSEDRKSFDSAKSEQKYYENLYFDLQSVKNNPQLAQTFIQTYPEKFHAYLKQVLNTNDYQAAGGDQKTQPQQRPSVDVDLYSRLQKLEKTYDEQQVGQRIEAINNNLKMLGQKYPQVPEKYVLAKVHDAVTEKGEKPTAEVFERAFKEVQAEFDQYVTQRTKNMQKEQLEANKKAKDVSSGGGTPAKAPQKFKSISDVTRFAVESLGKQ